MKRHCRSKRPVIRFRSMMLGTAAISALIACPLLMVWKQVYFTSSSLRIDKMTDSLMILSREIETLRLRCERLSSKDRIETIARTRLGLDHPAADRIVIIRIPSDATGSGIVWSREFMAFLKRSFRGDRG